MAGTQRKDRDLTIRTAIRRIQRKAPPAELMAAKASSAHLLSSILSILDDAKAENVVAIEIAGKSSLGDHMVVASGRSQRHVGAAADQIVQKLKEEGYHRIRVEGMPTCDWVLVDAGDVIVHIFRPEVREFYNLEKMWSADKPSDVMAS